MSGLAPRETDAIIQKAREYANSIPLETQAQFHTAVTEQLDRLEGRLLSKRRSTIQALAEVEINPTRSRTEVFKRKDVVSPQVFYATDKDWFHNPNFREVLETVIAIYQRWDAEQEMRETAERQKQWRESAYAMGTKMADVAMQMLGTELHEIIVSGDNGDEIVVKPARWSFRDVPSMATAADKLVRLSLDMATDKTEQDIEVKSEDVAAVREAMNDKLTRLKQDLFKRPSDNAEDADTAVDAAGDG